MRQNEQNSEQEKTFINRKQEEYANEWAGKKANKDAALIMREPCDNEVN